LESLAVLFFVRKYQINKLQSNSPDILISVLLQVIFTDFYYFFSAVIILKFYEIELFLLDPISK